MARYYRTDEQYIPSLTTALQGEIVDTLKKLAASVGSKKQIPTRKADLIDFIEGQLEGDKLKEYWRQMDDTQKAAVAETVHGPDARFNADQFVAKYGKNPHWGERDSYGYALKKPSLLSLFFFGGVMPDDLRRRFRQFVPEPEPADLNSHREIPDTVTQTHYRWDLENRRRQKQTEEVPIIRRPTEREACHDLKAVLRLIDSGKVVVSDKTWQPGAATMRTVNEVLLGGDYYDDSEYGKYEKIGPIKPFAWPLLVQAGGLAKLSGKRLELTANGQKAFNAPPEKTVANLWKRWLKTTLLDELRRIDCIKGQTGKGKRGLTAVAGRRAAINATLQDCPPGQWVSIDEFFRQMVIQNNTFEVTRDPWRLYIAEPGYGSLGYQGYHDWHILQVRYGLCLLFEYAATLGLIDVAYIPPHGARPDYSKVWGTDDLAFFSRYDGLLYLRVNPLGAYSLGMAENYTPSLPETRTELQVLPNLEIVVGGVLEPADELLLNTYANKASDVVWQLDQSRLLQAVEAGQDVATLREFLESRSGKPLPDTVIRFLQDMGRRTEQLQDKGMARLIECADATMAALIANDTRTKPHCLLAAERYLVVPAEAETKFRTALRKLGYSLPQ